ncbi:MAG TPA: hypothetical protein ENH15_00335, partial [Actinobacteria bacterium]|nr:hypothetical protein [Actinomycetota bacterium]
MNNLSFIATADWHLWPFIWRNLSHLRGDSEASVVEVTARAIETQRPVICAGDIMDHGEEGAVARELKFLNQALVGVNFFYVVGNHEESGFAGGEKNPRWLEVIEANSNLNATHLGGTVTFIDGFAFGGLDYVRGSQAVFAQELETYRTALTAGGINKLDVLVLHQPIKELLGFDGAYQTTQQQLAGLAHLVIIGDIHVSRTWEHEGTTFLSPGSTVYNDWAEITFEASRSCPADLGYWEVRMDKDTAGRVAIDTTRVTTGNQRVFFDLSVLTPEAEVDAMKAFTAFGVEAFANNIPCPALARVRYHAEHTTFIAELQRLASSVGVELDLRPVHTNTAISAELETLRQADGANITDVVIARHVDGEKDKTLSKTISEILADETQRPDLILERVVAE